MKCKKLYNYELTAVVEEEFDSAEKAAKQMEASSPWPKVKIIDSRMVFSTVKLLQEDKKKDGVQSKEDKGTKGSGGKGTQANV